MTDDIRDHRVRGRRKEDQMPAITFGRVLALVSMASVIGGLLVTGLGWLGGGLFGPGGRLNEAEVRMMKHEVQIAANRRYTDSVSDQVGALGQLVGATTIKSCLDAEPYQRERLKLAQAGVPCDSLYHTRGLRP